MSPKRIVGGVLGGLFVLMLLGTCSTHFDPPSDVTAEQLHVINTQVETLHEQIVATRIERMQRLPIDDARAHDLVVWAVDNRCIGLRDLPKVLHEWRDAHNDLRVATGALSGGHGATWPATSCIRRPLTGWLGVELHEHVKRKRPGWAAGRAFHWARPTT